MTAYTIRTIHRIVMTGETSYEFDGTKEELEGLLEGDTDQAEATRKWVRAGEWSRGAMPRSEDRWEVL